MRGKAGEVFQAFLLLGLTSFGGPIAHLGYFRDAFVARRRWIDEGHYADLVALCQFLPGPTSSQVGIAIGLERAGVPGALAAWLGFTLPSALLMLAFAWGATVFSVPDGILHGLKVAAFAVVAQAVWLMARALAPDRRRRFLAVAAAAALLVLHHPLAPLGVLAVAALAGAIAARLAAATPRAASSRPSLLPLVVFVALLAALPLLALTGNPAATIADKFYRAGSLVFGGGHVVLPLLQTELIDPGLIDRATFLAGYGAAQAVPGPLFSFAAYAGAVLHLPVSGVAGAALALVAIYVPSFLLVFGTLPWWHRLRGIARLRAALDFANAAVVGILAAALYDPVALSAITDYWSALLAAAALVMVGPLRAPSWLVVAICALVGGLAL